MRWFSRDETMEWDDFHLLVDETVSLLRVTRGDALKTEQAIRQFLERGVSDLQSPYVLWDYFAISSPSMPRRAGYNEHEEAQAIELFARLSSSSIRPGPD